MNNTARILPAGITEMSQLLETYEDYGKVDMGITKGDRKLPVVCTYE